ncbi:MAG: metallophosphoesterase family protein [Chloroflexi bacterium]|nr:metallophosphoesterase family protein [Chloroflexota bacterium]
MSTLSRRTFVRSAGATGLLLAAPELWVQPAIAGTPDPEQIHLQFGSDASREVTVSWATPASVQHPRVNLALSGDRGRRGGRVVQADTRPYVDLQTRIEVITHHALLSDLEPNTSYVYSVEHDGSSQQYGSFTTAPAGRAAFRFTSFGDQATPESGNGLASPWAAYNPPQVEAMQPLFHLLNGDLCYANISPDRVKTWHDFFTQNEVSARYRPWMPAAGNHENEVGNGRLGWRAYQTRFSLPGHGEGNHDVRGMWYSFKAGGVRVISLNNDDVCLQDGGDNYVRGYSDGAQHNFNGADLGIRQAWLPLFDKYAVDLVLTGHEHHFERTLAVRGTDSANTLRPKVADANLGVVDTTRGTVHMIIGGGGTSAPSNQLLLDPAKCEVITEVGNQPPTSGGSARPKRAPVKEVEDASWVGTREKKHAPTGVPTIFDEFVLQRPRRDASAQRAGATT